MATQEAFSRRTLVKGTGGIVVSFSLAARDQPVGALATQATPDASAETWATPPADELDSWLAVTEDGQVTVYTGKIDMGTGIETAFGQIVADELDVAFGRVEVVMGDTQHTPDQGKSTASRGISQGGLALRQAAAEARRILLDLASEELGVTSDQLSVSDGVVTVDSDSGSGVSYGALLDGRRFDTQLSVTEETSWGPTLEGSATPKQPQDYEIVGRSIERVDIPGKVTGEFTYAQDVRIEGMLYGSVVRPSSYGAELVSIDESSIEHIEGAQVISEGNFVGVVAEREEDAIRAAEELGVEWTDWAELPEYEELFSSMRERSVVEREAVEPSSADQRPEEQGTAEGDTEQEFGNAADTLEATYEYPFQLHAMLGPTCAVADVRDDRATIWSGTQWPIQTRDDIAQMLGLATDQVRVNWVEESGSYGRLAAADAAADAALLSRAVGAPVRVQWMRHDENGWEPLSPPVLMDLRGGLDEEGDIVAWGFEQWTASHATAEIGNLLAWRLMGGAPGHERQSGGSGGHPYTFETTYQVTNFIEPWLRAIYLRSPGGVQSIFAMESFMDELAMAAGADPVEFRLRYLEEPRAVAVLEAVAELAGWATQQATDADSSNPATGRGVAVASYGADSRVAMVADVEVDQETGHVRLRKMFVAHDCGLIINPAGVRHQIHGNVIQSTSRTLLEEVRFDRSHITTLDWTSYPILTFPEVPEIEIELIDRPDVPPSSVGEVGTVTVPAAIANAIYDATGARLRTIPFTDDRVKSALESSD